MSGCFDMSFAQFVTSGWLGNKKQVSPPRRELRSTQGQIGWENSRHLRKQEVADAEHQERGNSQGREILCANFPTHQIELLGFLISATGFRS